MDPSPDYQDIVFMWCCSSFEDGLPSLHAEGDSGPFFLLKCLFAAFFPSDMSIPISGGSVFEMHSGEVNVLGWLGPLAREGAARLLFGDAVPVSMRHCHWCHSSGSSS
eukprot:482126-Amphidinium_carterae.1